MAAPLLVTSGPAKCEAVLRSCLTRPVCLFYAMATVFQLYHDGDMMYEKEKARAYTFTDSTDL